MTRCTNPHGLFLQYNAEIKVLYPATVLQSLSIKKFGNKDLPVKPGEIIDVIVHPVEDKLIGRNSEGKCELICVVQVHIIQHFYSLFSLFQLAMCRLLIWSSKYSLPVHFYFYSG